MGSDGAAKITGPTPGDTIDFKTPKAIFSFIKQEAAVWQAWADAVKKEPLAVAAPVQNTINAQAQRWSQCLRVVESLAQATGNDIDGGARQVAHTLSDAYRNREVQVSRSPLGALILQLAKTDPSSSVALWAMWVPNVLSTLPNYGPQIYSFFWQSLASAMPRLATTVGAEEHAGLALQARTDAEAARELAQGSANRATQLADDSSQRLTEVISEAAGQIEAQRSHFEENTETALKAAQDEWRALKRAYDLQLKTRAPYNYWRAKRIFHCRAAVTWGRAFATSLVVGLVTIFGLGIWFSNRTFTGTLPWLEPIACLGVPAFLILWISRLTNRKYNDHLLRGEDAHERCVMVKTLLALTRSDQSQAIVSETQMATMLSALFRPGPGLNTEDSPSVSMIENVLRAVRGDAH